VIVIWTLLLLDRLEEKVFRAVKARLVPGNEPWGMWERAADALENGGTGGISKVESMYSGIGSVRREE